jgi:hypothetical protein
MLAASRPRLRLRRQSRREMHGARGYVGQVGHAAAPIRPANCRGVNTPAVCYVLEPRPTNAVEDENATRDSALRTVNGER